MNNKNKNVTHLYRGINEFKRGYQPISNLVMNENSDSWQIPTIFQNVEELFLSVNERTCSPVLGLLACIWLLHKRDSPTKACCLYYICCKLKMVLCNKLLNLFPCNTWHNFFFSSPYNPHFICNLY
jgi:hypothetical protein